MGQCIFNVGRLNCYVGCVGQIFLRGLNFCVVHFFLGRGEGVGGGWGSG